MSKNCLFIGPYRSNSGWGVAAREHIRSILASGANLTLRPVYMCNANSDCPLDFLQYEENKLPYYDVVIQNVLPHLIEYDSRLGKNIAFLPTETTRWGNVWASRLNRMDEVWVQSSSDLLNMRNSGVENNIKVVPVSIDVTKFQKSYDSKEFAVLKNRGTFIFYFIGEFIQRKGIDKLVQAFHTEFELDEPVDLLIKTSKGGSDPNKLAKELNEYCNRIKSILRIRSGPEKYKQEMFVTNRLSNDDMNALHSMCNCFVCPSMGESWNLPTMDALGFGKTPIVIENTGPCDMVDEDNGYVVPSHMDYVMVLDPPLPDLYTGKELWYTYTVRDLGIAMRKAYTDWLNKKSDKAENGMATVYDLTYEKVGQAIKELL